MLWPFIIMGLVLAPLGLLIGEPFIWGIGIPLMYLVYAVCKGTATLISKREVIYPLLDAIIFAVTVAVPIGLFGIEGHHFLLYTICLLTYTLISGAALIWYCKRHNTRPRDLFKHVLADSEDYI